MLSRFFALIPAAGKSRRMGQPKLLLPLGGRSVIEHVIAAFQEAAVRDIIVVARPNASALKSVVEHAGANVVRLDEDTPDMRTTVQRGLDWIETRFSPSDEDGWFLVPADHPTLAPTVITELARSWRVGAIAIPVFNGQRGHPALIGWQHVRGIRVFDQDVGLNAYFRSQRTATIEVPVDSAEVLTDLDTPQDYQKLQQRMASGDYL